MILDCRLAIVDWLQNEMRNYRHLTPSSPAPLAPSPPNGGEGVNS